MSKTFLKIKIMSLAAEAQIIRAEERKWPRAGTSGMRYDLAHHRRYDVRNEARSAQLAYGFLRGRAYRRLEAKCWTEPNATRIAEIVTKFGDIGKGEALNTRKAEAFKQVRAWMTEPAVAALKAA